MANSTKSDIQAKQACTKAANLAHKSGRLVQPAQCQGCGTSTTKLEKHHTDYNKPLEIQWLCNRWTVQLTGLFSPSEAAEVASATMTAHLTLSTYIRQAVLAAVLVDAPATLHPESPFTRHYDAPAAPAKIDDGEN